jgi:hypothetical protein
MTRDQLLSELMEQVNQLTQSPRLREDVRRILEGLSTLTLQSIYARNIVPLFMSICFKDFLSGAVEVPEVRL